METSFLLRHTTVGDRLLALATLAVLLFFALRFHAPPGGTVVVFVDNHPRHTLPLREPTRQIVQGKLGPVTIEIHDRRVRLREFDSPRMIGTRTGWIARAGEVAACVPCGVHLVVQAPPGDDNGLDAIAQ